MQAAQVEGGMHMGAAKGGVKTKRMSSDKGNDAFLRLQAFWFYHT